MKKLLIVDDSKIIISLLEKNLHHEIGDLEILKAESYKQALKQILKYGKEIDVAIIDLNLPDADDGAILEIVEANHIRSVVLSGFLNEKSKKMIFNKTCIVDYVAKNSENCIKSAVYAVKRIYKHINKNVLIVDDSRVQLYELKIILERMNLNVTTAQNGQEAYDIINSNNKKFSLVLTDYYMPEMDGMQLTFKLREKYDKDELGIIIISSSNNPAVATNFLKIGANDFINKPYLESEVITRVTSNLNLIDLFDRIIDMANKDFLTGLYNRRYFFDSGKNTLKKAIRAKKNLAVAMFDIDNFKNINDTYGHDVGDIVLIEVAKLLSHNMRETDLVCRLGGEEFCVLIEDVSLDDTGKLFESVRKKFEDNMIQINNSQVKFTTSIGICYGLGSELEKMLKIADNALYRCKNSGKNKIIIEPFSE